MKRRFYLCTSALAVLTIGTNLVVPVTPKLIWNASASAPVGLYAVRPADHLEVPDLVVVAPPEHLAHMLERRGYLPLTVPLLKRIVALPGQRVCRYGVTITVDGIEMAKAQQKDRIGRALPVWQGCQRIADGEVFLLNWRHPDSLDGRYFGPLPQSAVIGRAMPLLTDERGTGHYEWRAPVR
ncbi:S26 family signal peptidase [Hoeflea alexandrii]|uniref:S26 family signal peptidase n=1 Tax=Hoeflea alexandrii TaxID=288436 RepID=UPI0022AFD647|nr:S26 family signal peptidase [Hoeflea alexandrii]MCZ4288447.1 S26 family signal peptidase [Hoeflea alexandrii]